MTQTRNKDSHKKTETVKKGIESDSENDLETIYSESESETESETESDTDDDDDSYDDESDDDESDDDDYETETTESDTESDDTNEDDDESEEESKDKKRKRKDAASKKPKFESTKSKSKAKKAKAKAKDKSKKKAKAKEKVKSTDKQKKKRKSKKEEYDDEEDDDDEDDGNFGDGHEIILSIDGFGGGGSSWNNDEAEYKEMMKEDKNEVCDSDDEKTFMKETYEHNIPVATTNNSPPVSSSKKSKKINEKTINKKESTPTEEASVEKKYAEFTQLKKTLTEQLNKSPNNKILQRAIKECRKSISSLVKKERKNNTEKYFELVSLDEDKRNQNEMSFFKKKMSHKEQLKVMNDLTEINKFTSSEKPYRLALLESDIPPKIKMVVLQKLNVLKNMQPSDNEYYKMKNWVDGFMRVPYGIYRTLDVKLEDGVDVCHKFIEDAKTKLDSCVYGLNDAKLQILQMVGQWIANPSAMGTAIAIKGPMGTGKTTLVKDGISKILGREFTFIALGGNSDASFLEGHSYTYEGSSWGKIVNILMESKCMNPVIYFDELDKVSDTPKGEEIVGILTHLTDSTQNSQFHDKYFSEVDFDLSKCLFIFSYNDESKINPILRDRMYRIQTKGYDAKEKLIIARKHLLPKIREQVNFLEENVIIPDDTLQYIISSEHFSQGEQGVRNLKRCLEIIHTKLNLFRLVKSDSNLFEQDMKLEVKFPFTVERKHVDILIKNDDPISQSLYSMYV